MPRDKSSVWIDRSLARLLKVEAAQQDITMQDLLSRIVRQWFRQHAGNRTPAETRKRPKHRGHAPATRRH